ncbi:hypothetical protein RvY_15001 [Ramazzottius varieornatus]|uniref:Chitin-binding type-2 domain-containing protein n=1 Tax=Ramazzottius varieornatus TaxID=947166 RepID=A0A1D1VTB1_RAMVA|nr:hypothetical protein RvY_15001 [Ramazzottius varieornatus]
MKCLIVLSALVAVSYAANGDQNPKVWDALDKLRAKSPLQTDEIQQIYANAQPGQDFPILSEIPPTTIDCASFKQAGFYADEAGQCQVFHRCDVNGVLTSYLCPNMSLFNQITLVCDWFWNVDCAQSKQFQDYSNSRLYQEGMFLLDNQDDYELKSVATVKAVTGAVAGVKRSGSSGKKRRVKKTKLVSSESSSSQESSSQ